MRRWVALGVLVVLAACGAGDATVAPDEPGGASEPETTNTTVGSDGGGCADVVAVEIAAEPDVGFRFDVTVRSPDTGWDKYADRWEVHTLDGATLATRELTHPHVDEQPFTRSLSGVEIPRDTEQVVVVARDSVEGFCGSTMTVDIPH